MHVVPADGSKDKVPLGKRLIGRWEGEEKEWRNSPQIADRWPLSQYGSQGVVIHAAELTWSWKGRICMCVLWVIHKTHTQAHVHKHRPEIHTYMNHTCIPHTQVLHRELFLLLSHSGALHCTGFQGSEGGRGGAEGVLLLLWGPITQMDRAQHICWQNIIRLSPLPRVEPCASAKGPERNINVPNSICRSQSYFLDEQCRHFCVMDDEHAGIVCCCSNKEAGEENKSLAKLWPVVP